MKVSHNAEDDLAQNQSKTRALIDVLIGELLVWLISGHNAGSEKWENTGGWLAAVTDADWQMMQAQLIRRRGAGEEREDTHWWQSSHCDTA